MEHQENNGETGEAYTPARLRGRLENAMLESMQFLDVYQHSMQPEAKVAELHLLSSDGKRLVIESGSDGEGAFLQELNLTVLDTETGTQTDYNFNEQGDGELRKRVLSAEHPEPPKIPAGASAEDEYYLEMQALEAHRNTVENLSFEESIGINNQPASEEDIKEAIHLLSNAVALDPQNHYHPAL